MSVFFVKFLQLLELFFPSLSLDILEIPDKVDSIQHFLALLVQLTLAFGQSLPLHPTYQLFMFGRHSCMPMLFVEGNQSVEMLLPLRIKDGLDQPHEFNFPKLLLTVLFELPLGICSSLYLNPQCQLLIHIPFLRYSAMAIGIVEVSEPLIHHFPSMIP